MPARCTDCSGGLPHPWWSRCVRCAMARLRAMMSPFPITVAPVRRRFVLEDRVYLRPREGKREEFGEGPLLGTVVRIGNAMAKGEKFDVVVELDDGRRYYAGLMELEPETELVAL